MQSRYCAHHMNRYKMLAFYKGRKTGKDKTGTMRKLIAVLITVVCIVLLAGCGAKSSPEVAIDYGNSSIYSKEDMDSAIQMIKKEFDTWDGCELHSITYGTDEECNDENIKWMNELEEANDAKETFTQCIMFKSNFHSPKEGGGAWNADEEYTDWQWWLARSDGGQWKLMSWGY